MLSEPQFHLLDADELDYPAYVQLQRAAFAEVFRKTGVKDDYLTPEFFRWKYHSSSGAGKIAVVYHGSDMVAANAMMRYRLRTAAGLVHAWQSCDTASLPAARGRGYFKQCLRGLLTLIGQDEVFFGFPNANSCKGFLGIGWREYALLHTFVKPWFMSPFRATPGVPASRAVGAGLAEFLDLWMGQQQRSLVVRDIAYMQWRYFCAPNSPYVAFYGHSGGQMVSLAIGRLAQVTGRKVVLIMESMGLDTSAERRIRETAARWGFQQGASLAVDINSHRSLWDGLRSAFVRLPQRLLPKRNVFMGHVQDAALAEQLHKPWYVSVGDWDGF